MAEETKTATVAELLSPLLTDIIDGIILRFAVAWVPADHPDLHRERVRLQVQLYLTLKVRCDWMARALTGDGPDGA